MDALKNRPLFCAALCYAAGIALAVALLGHAWLGLIALAGLAAVLLFFRRTLAGLCMLAACVGLLSAWAALVPAIKAVALPQQGVASGRVIRAEYFTGTDKQGMTLVLSPMYVDGHRLPGRARVQLPARLDVQLGNTITTGDASWQHVGRDSGLWGQGVFYTLNADSAHVTDPQISLLGRLEGFRNHAGDVLDVIALDASPLLRGLILGQRTLIQAQTNQAFRDAGVAHLLSVSGLHVGFIAVAVTAILALLHVPRKARLLIEAVSLTLYSLLSGSSPPVWRSSAMFALGRLGKDTGKRVDGLTIWAAAFFGMLAIRPLQLLDVGFQLSFASVLGMALWTKSIRGWLVRWPAWLSSSVATMFAAQLGVIGLTAYYYGRISLVGLVANMVAIPLSGAVVLCGLVALLLGLIWLPLGIACGLLARALTYALILFVHGSAAIPFAAVDVSRPGALGIVLMCAAALPITPYSGIKKRTGWAASLTLLFLALLFWRI